MTKTNFKAWCIHLCVSWWADVEPPRLLQAAIRRNAAFRKSRVELDSLASQLKRDAGVWAESANTDGSADVTPGDLVSTGTHWDMAIIASPDRWAVHRRLAVGVAATAASCAILLTWRSVAPDVWRSSAANSVVVTEDQSIEAEMYVLVTVLGDSWDSSEASIASISSTAAQSVASFADISISDAVAKPVRSFSRGYGQTANFIAKHVEGPHP